MSLGFAGEPALGSVPAAATALWFWADPNPKRRRVRAFSRSFSDTSHRGFRSALRLQGCRRTPKGGQPVPAECLLNGDGE